MLLLDKSEPLESIPTSMDEGQVSPYHSSEVLGTLVSINVVLPVLPLSSLALASNDVLIEVPPAYTVCRGLQCVTCHWSCHPYCLSTEEPAWA